MEGSSSDQRAPKEQRIILNVLSPSTEEIPHKLTFSEIPVTTTVRALKERIQNAVPARPSLQRQRLIYQGKVLAADEVSLKDVFGREAISKSEPLSLHLVLSPLPGSHHRTSSVPPAVSSSASANVRQQWTPSFIPQANNPPNHGQPQQPTQQGAPPHIHQGPGPFPPSFNPQTVQFTQGPISLNQGPAPIPPHVQNAINNQLAAMSQQLMAHFAVHGQYPVQQGPPHNPTLTHQFQHPAFAQPSFQQIIAQQQQARAAAGQHGLAPNQQTNETTSEQIREAQNNMQGFQPNTPNMNTTVRENQGVNGESFRMVIHSTSISRPNSGMGHRPHSRASSHTPQRSSTPVNAPPSTYSNATLAPTLATGYPPSNPPVHPHPTNSLAMLQHRLSSIETSLAQGVAPPEAMFDHARTYLNNMASQPNTLPSGLEAPLRDRLNNLSTQAQHLRTNFNSSSSQIPIIQQINPGMTQGNPQVMPVFPIGRFQPGQPPASTSTSASTVSQATPPGIGYTLFGQAASQNSAQASTEPEMYLLSSPTGPHSLLLSPSGTYLTSFTNPSSRHSSNATPKFRSVHQPPVSSSQSTSYRPGKSTSATKPS